MAPVNPTIEERRLHQLETKVTELSEDLRSLRALMAIDVASSLNKVRFIAEKVSKKLCVDRQVTWGNAEPTLERMMGSLIACGVVPKDVAIHLKTIQANTSPGSHYQDSPLSVAHLLIAERALIEFIGWHYGTSSGESDSERERDNVETGPELAEGLLNQNRPPSESLRSVELREVVDWGWDGVRLLEEFIRMDYSTLEALVPTDEGDPYQWAPIFTNHPDTWRLLAPSTGSIAGYWHFAPLLGEEWRAAVEGRLLDSQITVDRVPFFELPGRYQAYFIQICLLPRYRTTRNLRLLMRSILDVLADLAREGVFISDVCANAYTPEGRSLCRAFSLEYVCPHRQRGEIHAAPIRQVLSHPIASRVPGLLEDYGREGLL